MELDICNRNICNIQSGGYADMCNNLFVDILFCTDGYV